MYYIKYHNVDISDYTFLITGGAGFIGSNIVEYLLKNGAGKVKVLDNLSNGFLRNIEGFMNNEAFEFIEGDICDYDTCLNACKGVDFVSHQAALGSVPRSVKDPMATNQANVSGFVNVLFAAKESNVKRLVYASSSSVYGDSKTLPKVEEQIGNQLSPYAVSKYSNELYANVFQNLYGLQLCGLRYFNIFGPKQDPKGPYAAVIPLFMDALLSENSPKIFGDGEQTRDFTFVENAVQANIKYLLSEKQFENSQVLNIAVGERITLNSLFNMLKDISGKDINPNYCEPRTGDIRDSLANTSKAEKTIGYKPEYTVNEGLDITFKWFKDYYNF